MNFITTEVVNYPVSKAGLTTRLRPRVRVKMDLRSKIVTAALIAAVVGMWYFLSPLTYGSPGYVGLPDMARKAADDPLQLDRGGSQQAQVVGNVVVAFRRSKSV